MDAKGTDGGADSSDALVGIDAPADVVSEPMATVATPTCTPPAGMYASAQSVTIATTTAGATVYYTIDGTAPSTSSKIFSFPIVIGSGMTSVHAIATAPGFAPSLVAQCNYTITIPPPDGGTVVAPTPSPAAGIYNNDFHVGLTTPTAGATICYTLDGSTPTCTAGVCQGTSKTYDASSQVAINGTVTDPTTGKVTVNALACLAGSMDASMPASMYELQVAQPTLQGPSPGALTYNAAARTVTSTVGSGTSGATGLYTATASIGAMVSCTNGTLVGAGPNPSGVLPSAFPIDTTKGAQTFWVVGCKPGYAQSSVLTANYTVTLNQTKFANFYTPSTSTNPLVPATPLANGTYDGKLTVQVDDTANAGLTAEYLCLTDDNTTPTCGAAGACMNGSVYQGGTTSTVNFATPPNPSATPAKVNKDGAVLQAAACTGAMPTYTNAGATVTPAYRLKLNPIGFINIHNNFAAVPTGTPIPAGGSLTLDVTAQFQPPFSGTLQYVQESYDYICWSSDGKTKPDCTCTAMNLSKATTTVSGLVSVDFSNPPITGGNPPISMPTTLMGIGCLASPSTNNPPTDAFQSSDVGTAQYQSATAIAAPTITPGATINNPTKAQFVNNDPAAKAYFCYTTNGMAPALMSTTNNTCFAANTVNGTTTCTKTAVAPGASSPLAEGPSVLATATTVNAIACDSKSVLQASSAATPVTYTLVVGNPTITPKGAVALGSAITIATVSYPVTGAGISIAYSEDGTTPDCSTAFPRLTVTCTGGACKCGGAACTDPTVPPDNGPFIATYYAMGGVGAAAGAPATLGGTLKVVGCATNYTTSPGTDTSTLTPFTAPLPTFTSPAGTYDDYISVGFTESPGTTGGWFCVGNGAGCGTLAGTCTQQAGSNVTPFAATANYTLSTSTSTHAGGQPSAAPTYTSTSGFDLPNVNSDALSAIACQPAVPAQAGTLPSGAAAGTYVFQVSPVGVTSPATITMIPTATTVTFGETPSTVAPDGNGAVMPVVKGATNGGGTFLCATTSPLGAQPTDCATLPALFGNANCTVDNGAQTQGANGPTLPLPDIGANTTFNIVACKNQMTWSTGTATLTFVPYSHTVGMTGAIADFTAGKEDIVASILPAVTGTNTAYVAWDATPGNLYLGLTKNVPALAATDYVQVYVGTNGTTGSAAADDGVKKLYMGTTVPTFPAGFNALYHVWWKVDNTDSGISQFTGGAWKATTSTFTPKLNLSSNFVEFAIPLTALSAAGNDLHLLGGVWTGSANAAEWPTGTTGNNNGANWNSWQTEYLNDGFLPNDPFNINAK
jgi:hypothetical protein